jgi:ribonuclease HI
LYIIQKFGCEKQQSLVQVRWLLPASGWVSLNTDGSCKEGEIIGCGGVIRGNEGEWLGGFLKFIGKGNDYIAELWGVYEELKLVRSLNFSRVELRVDSIVVVKDIE